MSSPFVSLVRVPENLDTHSSCLPLVRGLLGAAFYPRVVRLDPVVRRQCRTDLEQGHRKDIKLPFTFYTPPSANANISGNRRRHLRVTRLPSSTAFLHPSSAYHAIQNALAPVKGTSEVDVSFPTGQWFICHRFMKSTKLYMWDLTTLGLYPLFLFGAHVQVKVD